MTNTETSYMPEGYTVVQFCPCGHACNMPIAEVLKKQGAKKQQDRIDAGTKLDAIAFHSSDCPQCQADAAASASRTARAMADWPDSDWPM